MAIQHLSGSTFRNIVKFVINYWARFCLAGIIIFCYRVALYKYTWFSWHVILCTFGYLPLMAESFILFAGDEIWTRQVSRNNKHITHGVIVSVATVIVIIGNSLCFRYLEEGFHLYTIHGISGLISMILIIISLIIGFAVFYSQELKNYISPILLKFLHNFFGFLGFAVGIFSLCFGFYTHWFVYYTLYETRIVSTVFTVFVGIWAVHSSASSLYNQFRTVFKI